MNRVNIDAGNGEFPNGTKSLPEPVLNYNNTWVCGIHFGRISQEVNMDLIRKCVLFKSRPHQSGANELSLLI